MATTNQLLDQWRDILEKILQYYANLLYRYGDIITYVVVSRDPALPDPFGRATTLC